MRRLKSCDSNWFSGVIDEDGTVLINVLANDTDVDGEGINLTGIPTSAIFKLEKYPGGFSVPIQLLRMDCYRF